MRSSNNYWRLNDRIFAQTLRVLDSEGKQIGVMSRNEALIKAREKGLDLVEIAPIAQPPVAKIVDFGKFRYQEEKKLRKIQVKIKGGEVKEVRFSPFIAENDYQTRLSRVKEFLEDKNKVRLVVAFKGRQLGSKNFGYNLLGRIVKELREKISIDMEPKFLGRNLIMIISPYAKAKNQKITTK